MRNGLTFDRLEGCSFIIHPIFVDWLHLKMNFLNPPCIFDWKYLHYMEDVRSQFNYKNSDLK